MIATAKAKLTALLIAIICIIIVAWLFRETIALALQGHTKARLSSNEAQAGAIMAKDAIGATGVVSGRSEAIDATTRSNDDAIHSAIGADQGVDAGVRDAGLRSLCLRASYHGNAQCLRFAAPGAVEGGGAIGRAEERRGNGG